MRVFVLGTGRCGSKTFTKACQLVQGMTATHESQAHTMNLSYPDNHIEVDPHLVWHLGPLSEKYPNAVWVHLNRNESDNVRSLSRRRTIVAWGALVSMGGVTDRVRLAQCLRSHVNFTISTFLMDKKHACVDIDRCPVQFQHMCDELGLSLPPNCDEKLRKIFQHDKG